MEFITQSAVKIYYEFLHLRSFICLGMQKNMDIAELNNKIGYILSFPSAVCQRIKIEPIIMHHACKAWCMVYMNGRYAIKTTVFKKNTGVSVCQKTTQRPLFLL